MFVDGTSADGDYRQSPNGAESVTVTVTVEHDVVTAVEVVATGNLQFQTQFASGIAAEVVGKPLDEVEVSRVAGLAHERRVQRGDRRHPGRGRRPSGAETGHRSTPPAAREHGARVKMVKISTSTSVSSKKEW